MLDLKDLVASELPDIVGQAEVKLALKSALLVNRHVIIVGPPGIGKTTLARNVASLLPTLEVNDCGYNCTEPSCPTCMAGKTKGKQNVTGADRFIRIQGSPDLTAEDLLGDIDPIKALKFGPLAPESFTPGKIFKANNGILFFDEINRCTDKLQNALLQALEEGRVTLSSYDVAIPINFLFIGTMNPEDSSTEKLSDVFLDRFDLITMGYPENQDVEESIIQARRADLLPFQPKLLESIVAFVRQLREDDNLERLPSVRATLGIADRAQAVALLRGAKNVGPADVAAVVVSVLSHRLSLKPSVKYLENVEEYVRSRFTEFCEDHSLGGEG